MASPQRDSGYTEVPASILTAAFQVRGKVRTLGNLQTFLNDEKKPTLSVYNADVTGFDVTNPAARMTQPEMFITRAAIIAVLFETPPPPGQIVLPPHTESLMVYSDRFALSGRFHLGPDARLTDFAEISPLPFIVISDAKIYPLFQPRPALVQSAAIALLRRSAIRLYYRS